MLAAALRAVLLRAGALAAVDLLVELVLVLLVEDVPAVALRGVLLRTGAASVTDSTASKADFTTVARPSGRRAVVRLEL